MSDRYTLHSTKRSYIQQQIQDVVHALKKHGKWTNALAKFQELRDRLYVTTDVDGIERSAIFEPFLQILTSKKSGWATTKVVLDSLSNLIEHNFLRYEDPSSLEVINNIFEIVLQSRFTDVTRPDSDEMAEISILRLLLSCIQSKVGQKIRPPLVIDMIQKCFYLVTHTRKTEIFHENAEKLVKTIVFTICSPVLSKYIQINKKFLEENSDENSTEPEVPIELSQQIILVHAIMKQICSLLHSSLHTSATSPSPQQAKVSAPAGPVTTVISAQQADSIRGLALQIFSDIVSNYIENLIYFPRLIIELISDDLSRYLLEALRSNNSEVFMCSLRIYFNLFITIKSKLKLQLEYFFNTLIHHVLENKTKKHDIQEAALEVLVEFCSENSFITDIYVNYDSDLYCSNILEMLCKYLYKNAFPVSGSLTSKHILALNGLQIIIQFIAKSCSTFTSQNNNNNSIDASLQPPSPLTTKVPAHLLNYAINKNTPAKTLREIKQIKYTLMTAIERFNTESKIEGPFKFLQDNGLLPTPLDADSVARFFRNTPGLSKSVIGVYFGERIDFNIQALRSFITAFVQEFQAEDYSSLVSTVKAFLESFRLPGEAQKIERIFENFAQIYYDYHSKRDSPSEFPFDSSDGIFVMCFSIVMLNTDQHSPAVKKKMTIEEYTKLAKGTKYTKDLTAELIENIYYSIRNNEIKLPEEHSDDTITANTWQTLLRRSRKVNFTETKENTELISECNKDIFSIIWGPVIASLSVVFDTTVDQSVIEKSLNGFYSCATISAHYNLNEVFDKIVISVTKFSTLTTLYTTVENALPTQLFTFVENKRAHLASYTLFDIVRVHGTHLREAWKNVLDCLIALYKANLFVNLFQVPDFLKSEEPDKKPIKKEENNYLLNPLGYFLDINSWFGSSNSAPSDKTEGNDKLEAEKQAREIIAKCNIRQLIENTRDINSDSLIYLIKAVILASNKSSQYKVPTEKSDITFYLDLLTEIILFNKHRIMNHWSILYDYFNTLLTNSSGNLLKKVLANYFLISSSLISQSNSDQIIRSLDLITKLPEAKRTDQITDKITLGIFKFLETSADYIKGRPNWSIILSFLEFPENSHNFPVNKLKVLNFLIIPNADDLTVSYVCKDNFSLILNSLIPFVKTADIENTQLCAQLLHHLFSRVKVIFGFEVQTKQTHFDVTLLPVIEEAWKEYWNPILNILGTLTKDSRNQVRETAIVELQRSLLSPTLYILHPIHWVSVLDKFIFPLLTDFVNSKEVGILTFEQVGTLRLHGTQLLSKVFLQHLSTLSQLPWPEFKSLWMKILHIISLYMNESRENTKEAIKESLKNILLVMSMSGLFKKSSPQTGPSVPIDPLIDSQNEQQDIWDISWTWINAFCPSLQDDLVNNNNSNTANATTSPSSPQTIRETPVTTNETNATPTQN